jgi:HEAT repeat protein
VRLAAIEVLVTFGEAGDMGAIRRALDDTHPVIQLTAVRGLQEIASEEALVALQGHVEDPRPYIRAAVTKALQELCPDEEQNDAHIKSLGLYIILMTLYELYQEKIKGKHDWVFAMEFLAMIIDPDYQGTVSVNVNGQVITMPVDHCMPHATRRELEKFGKAILEGDLDAINRYRRNTTLFGAALPDSFDRLLPLLDDPDPELRELAVMSLAQTDRTKALPVLRSILKGSKRDLQRAAAMALKTIGSAAREDLKACSLNKDSIIRRAALAGIVEVFEPIDAMPFLRRALRDSRAINRCSAAEHIERLASSVNDQQELLKVSWSLWWRLTDDDSVRQAAHRALRVTADRIAELEVEQYVKSKKADDL